MGIIEIFASPEDACLYNRWASITPMISFGILYLLSRGAKIDVNMFYLLVIYASASYSARAWGKAIKIQKEITCEGKKDRLFVIEINKENSNRREN